ncbi:MAG: 3'-5' exonuclease [Candidatus Pristimantibacillus sp.]
MILGMDEGSFPNYRSTTERKIKDEHLIFYVCVSRAKSRYYLVRSKIERGYYQTASRFWTSLYNWNLERFGS